MESNTMNTNRTESKFDLRLVFSKYLMFILNTGFIISGILLISAGVSTYVMFETMYNDMGNIFRMLSIFWMVIGVTITVVATFGILAALKENEILANLYAISMTFVFLGCIGAGIADFTMISRSRFIVSDLLKSMINNYDRNFGYNYQTKMDWIQTKFECCGIDAPSDWQSFKYFWVPYDQQDANNTSHGENIMPLSCCLQNSSYVDLVCEKYHSIGCFEPIHQFFFETVMTIGYAGLIFSMFMMLAVSLGFLYAQIVRGTSRHKYRRITNFVHSVQE